MPGYPADNTSSNSEKTNDRSNPKNNGTRTGIVDSYSINEFIRAEIVIDEDAGESLYRLVYDNLNERDSLILARLKEKLENTLWKAESDTITADREKYVKDKIAEIVESEGFVVNEESLRYFQYLVIRDYLGYGMIDPLMHDSNLEDISCDGVGVPLFVYHKKFQNLKTNLVFGEERVLNSFIVFLAQRGGRQISVSDPILDASTPEGIRINATYGREVSSRGGTFAIRLFRKKPFTPVDLVVLKTATPEMMAYLWLAIEKGSNIVVMGGTGVGKTSTLNAISLFIPPTSKIVSIEDTREINIPHRNWISAVTRSGVGEGRFTTGKASGEIDMFDLLVSALRQRPDYVIVGEVRGSEAYNLFQAMSMGQSTLTTIHAHSIEDMITRLENQPLNIPRTMITSANIVVNQSIVRVNGSMERRITEVSEIVRLDNESNELILNKVFTWDASRDKIINSSQSNNMPGNDDKNLLIGRKEEEERERRKAIIELMVERGVTDYAEIWNYLHGHPASGREKKAGSLNFNEGWSDKTD